MKHPSQFTRRQWLGGTAATAGGMLMPGTLHLTAAISGVAETKHFWYRLALDGPYIDSQCDLIARQHFVGSACAKEALRRTWVFVGGIRFSPCHISGPISLEHLRMVI